MRKINLLLTALIIVALSLSSCKEKTEKAIDCDEFHWGYEEENGPDLWDSCYSDCGGDFQSPINITEAAIDPYLSSIGIDYQPAPVELINNGHSLMIEYPKGSFITFEGEKYELLQFHFHTGSEHMINNNRYAMEVHLVHKNVNNDSLAVIGVFFVEGKENELLNKFINNLPEEKDKKYSSEELINAADLLPVDSAYYYYEGSLTTPPCSEIVKWFVMRSPLEASIDQIKKMSKIMHYNYRPVKDLNGRQVKMYE